MFLDVAGTQLLNFTLVVVVRELNNTLVSINFRFILVVYVVNYIIVFLLLLLKFLDSNLLIF